MWYLEESTGDNFLFPIVCSNLFLLRNYKGHYIAQMASKWLKNKPKIKNFEPHASQFFIFTGDTNFPYFDHCIESLSTISVLVTMTEE